MRAAVLGGGLQGCCAALALADRGVDVTLFDCNAALMSRTAVANEGKVHLGYMYAHDTGFATARMMMQGALAFAPFFARHLGVSADCLAVSIPAAYAVHRDTQQPPEAVAGYLSGVHALLMEASQGRGNAYFGIPLAEPPRRWSRSEREGRFNGELVADAYQTPEMAVDPLQLARLTVGRIEGTASIEVRLRRTVVSVAEAAKGLRVATQGPEGEGDEGFDTVVNATWDGRLAIDATMGLRPHRPWLHRLKYGVSFRQTRGERPPSVTIICGPFGEVVAYRDSLTYLTWYPGCLRAFSSDLVPPAWPTYPEEPLSSEIARGTLAGLAEIVPELRALTGGGLSDLTVKGGAIVAWGDTDITDHGSELHKRYEIGVRSSGAYHSIDPGKLTMAPYFAEVCAQRISPRD